MGFLALSVTLALWAATAAAEDGSGVGFSGESRATDVTELVDETIPAPAAITAEPFAGDGTLGNGVLFCWAPVPGVSGYRIWRKIVVDYELDASGELVLLDQPEERWIPWARVDVSSDGLEVRTVLMTLDGNPTQWGVSAFVIRDGVEHRSPIRPVDDPATAIGPSSWGRAKRLGGR